MTNESDDFSGEKTRFGKYTEGYMDFIMERNKRLSREAKDQDHQEVQDRYARAQDTLESFVKSRRLAEQQAQDNWTKHRDQFDKIIEEHFLALRTRFRRALVVNEYGGVEKDERGNEVLKLLEAVGIEGAVFYTPLANEIARYIQGKLDTSEAYGPMNFDPDDYPTDGHEFERWVARSLKDFGWTASVTQGSGDQGIDVVAEREGIKLGIQCKLYSGPVGNTAVQEVIAGCRFYGLAHGAVISNSSFTRSAKELASATRVLLLGPADIPFLKSLIADFQRR